MRAAPEPPVMHPLAHHPSGPGAHRPRRSALRRRLRQAVLTLTVLLVAMLTVATPSVVTALTAPGTQSTTARLAEWARNHGLSPVVTGLEQLTYQPPQVGGAPPASSPLRHPVRPAAAPAGPSTLPPPVAPVASPALPGEGQWQTIATVHGQPAMAKTFLRPDATHTSYTAAAVWFDPHLVRATLHPGTAQPGGSGWGVAPTITQPKGLLAAFNAGFKLADAHGGFYENGRYAKPLTPGGASMVFYTDGTMTVGQWGRDVHMGPNVAAVRQNLRLLVDHGAVVPGTNAHTQTVWGGTIGYKKFVWRSGTGVTANGSIVNVIGPGLSAHSLAVLLQRAGAVRAMQLDINPEWTSYVLYHNPGAKAANLLPTMHRSPTRYNSASARDFVTLHAR